MLELHLPWESQSSRKEKGSIDHPGSSKDSHKSSYHTEACLTPAKVLTTLNALPKKDDQTARKIWDSSSFPAYPTGRAALYLKSELKDIRSDRIDHTEETERRRPYQ